MNALLDFLPALVFFAVYAAMGIYPATAALIIAFFALVGIYWIKDRKVHRLHLFSAMLAAVFGGLTLYLRNPTYIKLKPTVAYGLLALALLISQFVGNKVLLARIPQTAIVLPDRIWRRINLIWVAFFVSCAGLNLVVAYSFSERIWVDVNVFGFTVLTVLFVMAHAPFLMRYLPQDDSPSN